MFQDRERLMIILLVYRLERIHFSAWDSHGDGFFGLEHLKPDYYVFNLWFPVKKLSYSNWR